MDKILALLFDGQNLTREQTSTFFSAVMQGDIDEAVLAAALMAFKLKKTLPRELAGAAQALRGAAVSFPETGMRLADNCGTGGDGSHSINVSTAAAIVAAAGGVKMAKHGNRSVSSKCGSADVLEALDIEIDMTPQKAAVCLQRTGICFLFAPRYHPGFKHAMPVRKILKTRTMFNMLGPLLNPAKPAVQLIGVFSPELCEMMAQSLGALGVERALVVHGSGMDEVAIHAPTHAVLLESGVTTTLTIGPEQCGLPTYPLAAIKGGDVRENKRSLENLLSGKGADAHRAVVAMNAGALFWLYGICDDIEQGVERAMDLMSGDAGMCVVEKWSGIP